MEKRCRRKAKASVEHAAKKDEVADDEVVKARELFAKATLEMGAAEFHSIT